MIKSGTTTVIEKPIIKFWSILKISPSYLFLTRKNTFGFVDYTIHEVASIKQRKTIIL